MSHHSYRDGTHYPKEKCPIYAAFKDEKVRRESEEVFWKKDGSSFPVEYISKPIIYGGKSEFMRTSLIAYLNLLTGLARKTVKPRGQELD